jgi:hypothetical protein
MSLAGILRSQARLAGVTPLNTGSTVSEWAADLRCHGGPDPAHSTDDAAVLEPRIL